VLVIREFNGDLRHFSGASAGNEQHNLRSRCDAAMQLAGALYGYGGVVNHCCRIGDEDRVESVTRAAESRPRQGL
jgi:hypothetical protein